MVFSLYRYPEAQAPAVPISGLRLTIPKGRVAEVKKNHLELAESTKGLTKSTGR
ncbi:MAG: Uncharacterised protein [Flavobacteriaceae bacterium]|nr:MAG: Uncharacterised protein [Flavobacteriaceae bacterium]